jgi:VanZ like family
VDRRNSDRAIASAELPRGSLSPTDPPWYGLLGRLPRVVALLLALTWAASIWQLSSGPIDVGVRLSFGRLLNNLAHGPVYALLAGALCFALPRRAEPFAWPALTPLRSLAVLCFTGAYGCLDEWHQLSSPGRHGSWSDLLTDLCGAYLALAAVAGLANPERRGLALHLALALMLMGLAALLATYGPELSISPRVGPQ